MKTSYHFYLRKDKTNKKGECPIFLRITTNRKSRYVSTGVFIKQRFWNDTQERIRKSHKSHKALNSIIEEVEAEAKEVQAELNDASAPVIKKRLQSDHTGDFFQLLDNLINELEHTNYHMHNRSKIVKGKVEEYVGDSSLPLKSIDTDWLYHFETFLKLHYGNGANTISKDFEVIKKVVNKALEKHLLRRNPFDGFNGAKRKPSKNKTKLTIDQIRAIEALDLVPYKSLWHTRNIFLFSFYSGGIRAGDTLSLKWSNVQDGRLSYKMSKNKKPFSMALNPNQQAILDLYKAKKDLSDGGYIFPYLDSYEKYEEVPLKQAINSKTNIVNANLKRIADSINEKIEKKKIKLPRIPHISFHVSRHSFAQYAIEQGLTAYELMHALKHYKLETTQRYLKSLNEEMADEAMSKVF